MLDVTSAFGLVLLVSVAGRTRWAVGLAAVAICLTLVHPAPSVPLLWWTQTALLIGTPLCLERSCTAWDRWRLTARQQLAAGRTRLTELDAAIHTLTTEHQRLEARIDNLHQLYTVTKATAPVLHADELVMSVAQTFARFCAFRQLRFLQMHHGDNDHATIAATFSGTAPANGSSRVVACDRVDGAIVRRYLTQPTPTVLSAQEAQALTGVEGQPSIGWSPLLVESQWAGLWVIEGLDPAEADRFFIVTNQASLQLARVQLYQRLEALAVTDSLTELFVRRHFVQRAQEELLRAQRLGWSVALLMLDLDHFKDQNDQYGHLVGDAILQEIAQRIRSQVRQVDLVGRWGGEEFTVLLVDTKAEEARYIAERIRATVADSPVRAYDETITQTVSIGIALSPQHGTAHTLLVDRADTALYQAKTGGRNRVAVYA